MATLITLRDQVKTKIYDTANVRFTDSEIESALKDRIRDWVKFVFRESFTAALSSTANSREVDVTSVSPTPAIITYIEAVVNATNADYREVAPDKLWAGKIYFPAPFTAVYALRVFYLGKHTIPATNSETLTINPEDEIVIIWGAMAELLNKAASMPSLSQSTNELRAHASVYESKFQNALNDAKNSFSSMRG